MSFNHLHTHTQYSLLDGMNKIPNLVEKGGKNGMGFVVTDHGNLFALPEVLEQQDAAKTKGIKVGMGCEVYMTDDRFKKDKETETYHLTVIAKNNVGLENLMKLSTRSYAEGFYGKPRMDLDLLSEHREGLIVLSGCLGGQVAQALKNGDTSKAMNLVGAYRDIFKDDYFLEVMPLEMKEQIDVNKAVIEIGKKTGLQTVTTCDCHYLEKEHYHAHDTWLAIQTKALVSDEDRFRFTTDRAYFQTPEEVLANSLQAGLDEESMNRTQLIMDRIEGYSVDKALKMPVVENAKEKLREEAYEGLRRRGLLNRPEYRQRLDYELGVIDQLGFSSYFLLVQKIIAIAKQNNIPTGPGRGSAAGSLVVWSLGVTDLDPIRHGLIFERFLNPARVSPPDIDLDIGTLGRGDVIKSIVKEYGADKVATIMTLGLALDKMVLKDVMRAEGYSFKDANIATAGMTSLDNFVPQTDKDKDVIEKATLLNGTVRNVGTHAAGIVISPVPLFGNVPLMYSKVADEHGIQQIQYDMAAVEKMGFIKIDVLGLKELDILHDLSIRTGRTPAEINFMSDKNVFAMIKDGDTTGVFQLGTSEGMKKMLRAMRPESFEEVCAALSLFRPGPLESGIVDAYIANKNRAKNGETIPSLHPLLDKLLAETYGVPIYQEQIMEMGKTLAGFDMKEADLLRRAMGKKKPEEMAKMKEKWMTGCAKNGISDKDAEDLFAKVEHFSGYGFNKSHSAAYAVTAMKMSWYKCHFPAQYWASKISFENSVETRGEMAEAAKREGITILPPHIYTDPNVSPSAVYSSECLVLEDGKHPRVQFGIESLKGISSPEITRRLIDDAQKNGPFKDFSDVYRRLVTKVDDEKPILDKRVMMSLASVGFFDPLSKNRRDIIDWIESKYKNPGRLPGLVPVVSKTKKTVVSRLPFKMDDELKSSTSVNVQKQQTTESAHHEVDKELVFDDKKNEKKVPEKKNVVVDKINTELSKAGTVFSGSRTEVVKIIEDYFVKTAEIKDPKFVISNQRRIESFFQNDGWVPKKSLLIGTLKEARMIVSKKTQKAFYVAQMVLPEDASTVSLFIWEDQWARMEKTFKENKNKVVVVAGKLSDKKEGWDYSLSVTDIYPPAERTKDDRSSMGFLSLASR